MTRKICIVTGTRAEYGLLRGVMEEVRASAGLSLQIVATGAHLSPEFGLTYREIEADGFVIDRKVEMLTSSDTPVGIAKSMGLGLIGFADAFADLAPDILVVLGDRSEILAAVSAALVARIPVAHLHGGEVTVGAVDDAIRHAITKMSHWHFAANQTYRQRIIQLGETPENTHVVGGLGVDAIVHTRFLDRAALEQSLGIKLAARNLLVTFHPATLEDSAPREQMEQLLAALAGFADIGLIFTFPNADAGGRDIIRLIQDFVARFPNAHAFTSLGQLRYLSCMHHCDGVVGNSSSGLLEAPTMKKGTVNIGDRQRGRLQAESVINCAPTKEEIEAALHTLLSPVFQAQLDRVVNPYGDGGASGRIVQVLKSAKLDGVCEKTFFDLPVDFSKM